MKKLLLILLSALFLGACAQKTCPTYAFDNLDTEQSSTLEQQSV